MKAKPPARFSSGDLFALVMQPCPLVALDYECPALPGVTLYARAIQASVIVDAVRAERPHRIVGAALADHRGVPLFSDPEKTLLLRGKHLEELQLRVDGALDEMCPTYQFADWPAWKMALSQGMMSNGSTLMGMQACFDLSLGIGTHSLVARPDRYFGKPVGQLLDGHLMAFSVVSEWLNRRG